MVIHLISIYIFQIRPFAIKYIGVKLITRYRTVLTLEGCDILLNLYKNEWNLFKQSYWKMFVMFFVLFIGSSVASYFLFLGKEDELTFLLIKIQEMFIEKGLFDLDMSSFELAIMLLKNNATASFIIYATGIIPLFIPAIFIIIGNGALAGIVFASMKTAGQGILLPILTGIVPHGIFEIPAIVLSASLAFYVSAGIIRKIVREDISLREYLFNSVKTFLLVVLPLLVIAAFVEAYISPALMRMAGL